MKSFYEITIGIEDDNYFAMFTEQARDFQDKGELIGWGVSAGDAVNELLKMENERLDLYAEKAEKDLEQLYEQNKNMMGA